MINDGINNIPDNKIAVIIDEFTYDLKFEDIKSIIKKPSKKRDWFTPNFYRCLPLTIANQYGLSIVTQHDFSLYWNGGEFPEDLIITPHIKKNEIPYPKVASIFGHGIFSLIFPFHIKTPPGVNIMTINPPNTVLNNITVMSGVVETDNLRQSFTVNLKLQFSEVEMMIKAGTEIATILPVPRYFCDSFDLINGEDVLSQEIYNDEVEARRNHDILRDSNKIGNGKDVPDGLYMRGFDIYNNKFKDHQKP